MTMEGELVILLAEDNRADVYLVRSSLKKHGIAVEYLVKENEGHGFANEENRFEFHEAMETFLKKHLS